MTATPPFRSSTLLLLLAAVLHLIAFTAAQPDPIFVDVHAVAAAGSQPVSVVGAFAPSPATDTFRPALFRDGRTGTFSLSVPLPTRDYAVSVSLGLVARCSPNDASLSVSLDAQPYARAYNVRSAATACLTPHVLDIPYHMPASASLTVRLEAAPAVVVAFASVSFRRKLDCTPAAAIGQLSDDHSAHSVPGTYAAVVDADGDGSATIMLDGTSSHTHFFNPELDVIGRLTTARWEDLSTNRVLSNSLTFSRSFPVGTTSLKLTVRDNACDEHSAMTSVTITPQRQPGAYCELIPLPDSTDISTLDLRALMAGSTPQFGLSAPTLRPNFINSPFAFAKFAARCVASVRLPAASNAVVLDTEDSGAAEMYDATGARVGATYTRRGGPQDWNDFTLYYARSTITTGARLSASIGGRVPPRTRVTHGVQRVRPGVTGVFPPSVRAGAPARVRLAGSGLYPPCDVLLDGRVVATLNSGNATVTELSVKLPAASSSKQSARLSVRNGAGKTSNAVTLRYEQSACAPPAFRDARITTEAGADVDWIRQPTSVAIGPDRRLYIGTLNGSVAVLGYDAQTLTATTYCYGDSLTDPAFRGDDGQPAPRSILGMAFNPAHGDTVRPYVSVSTVNFWRAERISRSNSGAWRNGAIERLKLIADPGNFPIGTRSGRCVGRDRTVLSGIPVANGGSHSVNAIVFSDNGDLLVAVGGSTNMGLPGVAMGGLWESPLSAAVLRLPHYTLSRTNAITYTGPDTPHQAVVAPGNTVRVHATGLRNMFTMTVARDGSVFAVDQGPGCPLGGAPGSCDAPAARPYDVDMTDDWPSPFPGDEGECSGTRREDKVLRITRGAWYGHANIARGQCDWVDPLTGLTLDGRSVAGYTPPITVMPASVTSVTEFASPGRFCGALTGRLVLSMYRGVGTFSLDPSSSSNAQPKRLSASGGTSMVEDAAGNLVFPRLTERFVAVLVPDDDDGDASTTRVFGVTPRRIRQAGSVEITVAGRGFADRFGRSRVTAVRVGNADCPVSRVLSDALLTCTAPARVDAGSRVPDVEIIISGGQNVVAKRALAYLFR